MERAVSRIVLGMIVPATLFMAGWFVAAALFGDSVLIPLVALGGIVLGLVFDMTLLRRRLDSLYDLSPPLQAAVALYYAVVVYGFFMGVPVGVLLVGLGWGFAAANGTIEPDLLARRSRIAALGSASLMLAACLATVWLAFREPSIAAEVRGMLGLAFTPSVAVLALGSLVGGAALVSFAYAIPVVIARRHHIPGNSTGATF